MSIPGCQRPASSPYGEVTVPAAGQADQTGPAGCATRGVRTSAMARRSASTRTESCQQVARGGPTITTSRRGFYPPGERARLATAYLGCEPLGERAAAGLEEHRCLLVIEAVRLGDVLDPVAEGADSAGDAARVVDVASAVEHVDGHLPRRCQPGRAPLAGRGCRRGRLPARAPGRPRRRPRQPRRRRSSVRAPAASAARRASRRAGVPRGGRSRARSRSGAAPSQPPRSPGSGRAAPPRATRPARARARPFFAASSTVSLRCSRIEVSAELPSAGVASRGLASSTVSASLEPHR